MSILNTDINKIDQAIHWDWEELDTKFIQRGILIGESNFEARSLRHITRSNLKPQLRLDLPISYYTPTTDAIRRDGIYQYTRILPIDTGKVKGGTLFVLDDGEVEMGIADYMRIRICFYERVFLLKKEGKNWIVKTFYSLERDTDLWEVILKGNQEQMLASYIKAWIKLHLTK